MQLDGVIDIDRALTVRDALLQAIWSATGRVLEVRLADVRHLDTVGLAVLVEAFERASEVGVELVFRDPSPVVAATLAATRLDRVLTLRY